MATKKAKRRTSKASKVETKKINSYGWDTTDEDEIIRRKLRAQSEDIIVKRLDNDFPYFGSFLVYSNNWADHDSAKYLVEIRSLNEYKNSCSCLDFQTNGLGTCKHIERVLLALEKQGKRKFKHALQEGSQRTEIYLDTRNNESKIKIEWPRNLHGTKIFPTINQFFSADQSLIGEPIQKFSQLKKTIEQLKSAIKKQLRISAHINIWIEMLQKEKQKEFFKTAFSSDINAGKYSLNILKYPLYPYQQDGMLHLLFNQRALLADEMGLGKTIQAIAACELLRQTKDIKRVLVVATASLKAEWEEQIAKFSNLKTIIVQGSRKDRLKLYQQQAFFYLTNYEQILYDGADIQRLVMPDVIILDEAQRIKNWHTKTATAVKKLSSYYAFVLTGTPLENRIDDIYSVIQFLNPHLFGSLFQFNRHFYCFDEKGRPASYKNLDELHRKLKPILLRRKKSDVEDQLPERTVNNYFVGMDNEQASRYEEYSTRVARLLSLAKRRPLRKEEFELLQKYLACMRMLCDTPYILDQDCRISPKLRELEKILEELLEDKQAKVIIFSEWAKMLQLIKELAEEMKLEFAWHTGSVPQHKRRLEIKRFKEDSNCRLFLSTDSGSVGLNLQAANIVINIDMPWNPAKLEQRIARAWRKHQTRNVQVINLVCEDSIEHRMLGLLEQKKALAENILHDGNIKNMDMPSGRAAFMERLEAIMDMPKTRFTAKIQDATSDVDSEQQALDKFKNDLFNHCQDNLISLQKHKNPDGKQTLFAVVETSNDQTHEAIQHSLQTNKLDDQHNLVLLDKKTHDTIQQLAELGLITINQQTEKLFESPTTINTQKKQQKARIQKARKHLEQTDRKYRMASLLADGGFYQEAIAPLIETVSTALAAFAYVNQQLPNLTNNNIAIEKLQQTLRESTEISHELLDNILSMQNCVTQVNEEQIKTWLKNTDSVLNFVEQSFNKLALS